MDSFRTYCFVLFHYWSMEELVFVYDFLAFEQLLVFVFEIDLLFVFTSY